MGMALYHFERLRLSYAIQKGNGVAAARERRANPLSTPRHRSLTADSVFKQCGRGSCTTALARICPDDDMEDEPPNVGEAPTFTPATRIAELNDIDQSVSTLLAAASDAIAILSNLPSSEKHEAALRKRDELGA